MTRLNDELVENVVNRVLKQLKSTSPGQEEQRDAISMRDIDHFQKDKEFSDITKYSLYDKVFVKNPIDEEYLARLKKLTPARICLGRTGPRYLTVPWLRFKADHALAKDAVFSEVSQEFLNSIDLFTVQTIVRDKDEYLTRPDLGKLLSEEGKNVLREKCTLNPEVQIIVVDGLSSTAIEANVPDFLPALLEGLKATNLKVGVPFFVKHGRVPIMDDVNEVIKADVIVELIGERPGLGTASSMSAYLCWRPKKGTVESDRTVVSNIHKNGMLPTEAGAHVASIVKRIYDKKGSGINVSI